MKIVASNIGMTTAHAERTLHEKDESLVMGEARPGERWSPETLKSGLAYRSRERKETLSGEAGLLRARTGQGVDTLTLSPEARAAAATRERPLPPQASPDAAASSPVKEGVSLEEGGRINGQIVASLEVLVSFVERLTGRKIVIFNPEQLRNADVKVSDPNAASPAQTPGEAPQETWGLEYHSRELYYEAEATHFQAQGVVRTEDGREIALNVELNLSREFMRYTQLDVEMGAARLKDPLVINVSTTSAELDSSQTFRFDIDIDGSADELARLKAGSGFLALDRNADGKINDGSELFGATSGDGFADLAQYDEDGSLWIDEGDTVFTRLKVWMGAGGENAQMMSLSELSIGAIYLGRADTAFSLKDTDNNLLGVLRATGVYLRENGQVGTVQQMDFKA